MTDEKTKDIWETIKQLQIQALPQKEISEVIDRTAESIVKKRTRLEVEEF